MANCFHHPGSTSVVTHNGRNYCQRCRDGQVAAAAQVDAHVQPPNCFVWYTGGASGWTPLPGTGCAHWVAHQLGIRGGAVCLEGYTIRVPDLVRGRQQIAVADVQANDIWANSALSHTGLVVQVHRFTGRQFVVDVATLNIRSGPGTDSEVTGTLTRGTMVVVVATQGEWQQLREGGWVNGRYLSNQAQITIRHDSSGQGGVRDNDFVSHFGGNGAFYR